MIACSAMTPTIMGPAGNSSVIIQKGQTLLAHKCGGYDYGVDVESDDVQIYGPPGKNPPAGRYLW